MKIGRRKPADFFCHEAAKLENSPAMMIDSADPRRHLWLLISLVVIFIVSPFVVPDYYGPSILKIIAAVVLLSATYAVSRRRSFFIFALSLSIFSIGLTFWLAASPNHWLIIISHGSLVILIVFFAAAMSLLCFGQRKGDLGQNLRRGLRLSSFGLCLDFRLFAHRRTAPVHLVLPQLRCRMIWSLA